jgi:RNA polymerase sigma factor for flagellar operon FliA
MARTTKNSIKAATERYLVDRSEHHRDRLVELLLPWIRGIARHVKGKMVTGLDAEDLEQAGVMGLIKALPRYDGSTAITTFGALRVKGAMIDECREANVVPRLVQNRLSKILTAEKELAQQLGRKATAAEIEAACQMSRADFLDAQQFRTATHHVSIVPTFKSNEMGEVEVPTETDAKAPAPTLSSDRQSLLQKILKGLSTRERLLILGYYFEEHTMKQVGQALDLSESRVSQMHSRMLEQLRDHHRDQAPELFELARAS